MSNLLVVGGVSFAVGLIFMRLWIAQLAKWKMKQVIREDGPESHLKKTGTLTMGGVAIFAAWIVTLAVTTGFGDPKIRLVVIVAGVCFLLGLGDDLAKFFGKKTEGVKARYKLVVEIALGVFMGMFILWLWSGAEAVQTDTSVLFNCPEGFASCKSVSNISIAEPEMILAPKWLAGGLNLKWMFVPFITMFFVGTVNASNLTDGLDGLLSGCFLIMCAAFIYIINKNGDRTLVHALVALAGPVAAFLWYNTHPAKIFAGDAGSLFLGGVLASVVALARLELMVLIVGGVLVAEALSVMIQVVSFRLTGKRVFPMTPLHHSFEISGWSEPQIVVRFWIVSAICSGAGVWMFIR